MRARPVLRSLFLALAGLAVAAPDAWAARGGPDAGGWVWADSNEALVDASIETPAVWTTIAQPIPDQSVFPVTLSFPFTLYDVTSQTVYLSSNGWISLVDPGGQAVPGNPGMPDPALPNATIAFQWDALGTGAQTWAKHGATPNGHLIQYYQWHPAGGNFTRVDIQFYRSGALKIVYEYNIDPGSVTIGIENGDGSAGSEVVHDGVLAPGVQFAGNYALYFHPVGVGPDCAAAITVSCPGILTGSTAGGSRLASSYACTPSAYSGSERVFGFQADAPGSFKAVLGGTGGRNLDLFLLTGSCSPTWECVAGASDLITIAMLPAGQYYLVVDGRSPADDGDFTLELGPLPDKDCNRNGIPGHCDVQSGTSKDCNGNGLPDECDAMTPGTDCNQNRVPDSCDVASGTSKDCNANGLPDECDAMTPASDCNRNRVPDSCDIADGTSQDCNQNGRPDDCDVERGDCNHNGVPDACDIAKGTSEDCNADGRPDECRGCPVDVVFIMDTSGSMGGVAAGLCSVIDATVAALQAEGIEFGATVWGLADTGGFSCLTDSVLNQLGSTVPGPPFPVPPPISQLLTSEDWGPGTAVVAGRFPWVPGAFRIVVPISDEGSFQGNPVNDPGDDRDSITHAISVARANRVLVSPISPSNALPDVMKLAQDLAAGTGGQWFGSGSSGAVIADAIVKIARDACLDFGGPADAGPDQRICSGTPVTLDGSATTRKCQGSLEYHWLAGGSEPCGTWSTLATCTVQPATTTEYTLEIRCPGEPVDCSAADRVTVEVDGGEPPSLENSLRAYRWTPLPYLTLSYVSVLDDHTTYNVYRGTEKGTWPAALLTGLRSTATLADVPSPPSLYFYRATALSCNGVEGP